MRLLALFLFVAIASLAQASEELIVVAKPIAASLSDKTCDEYIENDPTSKLQEICVDRVFNVSYQVLAVITGDYSGAVISGIDFYHYSGLPDHMIIDPACVTFRHEHGEYIHIESVPAKKGKVAYVCEHT